jgi:hypothetical protein
MKKRLISSGLFFILMLIAQMNVYGQITTSGMKGRILDEKNEVLPGASVVAIHMPSGTQYGILTNEEGRFSLNNMRVGGPYQVTVSFVGYQPQVYNDINLSLGNVSDINITLSPSVTNLSEVIVSAGRGSIINSERTGAAINVSNEMVASVPTISRGLKDFTKISPLANNAGSGTSFAGSNNRYNQFAIDGLVNNDVFGLAASGTNGGQTGIEPISLDAIEEFQINIAPYDVRQGGFTGGGINAVTKSGTNEFKGSAYYYGNNQGLVGKNEPIGNTEQPVADYTDYQAGFTLGGPIVKNKVFFFLNGEITKSITPLSAVPGTSSSDITLDEINRVLAVIQRVAPSYDPGNYLEMNDELNSRKILAKINWNISDKHKLTIRHSYTFGENIDNSRSRTSLRFYNNGQYFPTTTNSTGIELNSIFNSNMSNRFMLGYTRVRDDRDPLGSPFSTVLVHLGSGRSITMGSEYSSVANQLDQDIYSLTNDLTIFKGKHTITVGTHNELYSFYNLFVQNIFGNYAYNSLANFETVGTAGEVAPTYYGISYSFDPSDDPLQTKGAADFYAMQLGIYGQDEYQLTDGLQITGGLRIDVPVFPEKPPVNDAFNTAYASQNVATGDIPSTKILWSPRVGFNWDVLGNKTLQVRGGTGLFTGRVPFVWISNQFSNNGEVNGTFTRGSQSSSASPITNPAGLVFQPDPFNQPLAEDLGFTAGRGAINVVDKDLQFPQVFRTNIAVDKKLPWGLFATVEGIFSKTYNNVNFVNLNRSVDNAFTFNGPDTRPRYLSNRLDANFDEIVKFENTDEGYSYNIVAMLQKQFESGLTAQVSYTYGKSMDLNSGTSSVAYSNWRYVNNVYGLNDLRLSRSNFDLGSRITGLISYKVSYLNDMLSTQVSLFYNGQSGQPISYIYNGDMNNDGTSNDLIYIPSTQSDINLVDITGTAPKTAAEQWSELDAFISGNEYLNSMRGQYAERNGARLPFQHNFDLKILQDVMVNIGGKSNKLQLSLDIINLGNLLNKEWGHVIYASNQQFSLINYTGLVTGTSTPRFTYNPSGLTNGQAYSLSDFSSRWRAQIGLRYIFN